MIADIPPELIPIVGSFLGKVDRYACHLAAKCFHSISYNIRECALLVSASNFDQCMNSQNHVHSQKKRTPYIDTVRIILHDLDNWDISPILNSFREVFPNVTFKAAINNCKNYDKLIAGFPHNTEVRLIDARSRIIDISLLAGKRFSYVRINHENVMRLFHQKTVLDTIAEIDMLWESDIDLSDIDPRKTCVTLRYHPYYSSDKHVIKDIIKVKKLHITDWSYTSLKMLAIVLARSSPNFKESSHLIEVDLTSHYYFAIDHLSTFLDCLPKQCKISVSNIQNGGVYLLEVLYEYNIIADIYVTSNLEYRQAIAVNMITRRKHHITFSPNFVPSKTTYISLQEVWDHMNHNERSSFGLIKYYSSCSNTA